MLETNSKSQSINFLEPVKKPTDIWANAYVWLVTVGKYLLLVVEIVVLGVFVSRFILDRRNNDLTKEINTKVALLSNETWKKNAAKYENFQILISDIGRIRENQVKNSSYVSEIINGVPAALSLESFTFTEGKISLFLTTTSFEAFNNYETAIKNNPNYGDVNVSIVKEDSEIEIRISFYIINEG